MRNWGKTDSQLTINTMTYRLNFTHWAVPVYACDRQSGKTAALLGFKKRGTKFYWVDAQHQELDSDMWEIVSLEAEKFFSNFDQQAQAEEVDHV